jgi:creatinine amidohydrolase
MHAEAEGDRLLRERVALAPTLVRAAIALDVALPFDPAAARGIVTTGLGSSAAQAKLLAHLLTGMGLPARFVPPGAFALSPPPAAGADDGRRRRDALVVFSQGLSPNARIALRDPAAWLGIVLVTAVEPESASREARTVLGALAAAGGLHLVLPGGAERGLLLRVAGPIAGMAVAFRLAEAIARGAGLSNLPPALDAQRVAAAMSAATAAARRLCAGGDPFAGTVLLIASGGHGDLADNLRLKLVEGLFEPVPPVCDLIEFAHGPFQSLYERPATFVVLERRDAAGEPALLERFAAMLRRDRHRMLRLPAELPGPLALFEHEAGLTELVVAASAARGLDQTRWPGRGHDAPLYDVSDLGATTARNARPHPREGEAPAEPSPAPVPPPARSAALLGRSLALPIGPNTPNGRTLRLADLTWPEIEARLASGRRTVVVPLGSTEQHGPHLPFATDTLIAEALAERLSARLDAVHTPAVSIGCSAEHAGFAGSLALRWDTLRALLVDTIASLVEHGFDPVFVFSAHGGNAAALHESAAALTAAGEPAQVLICADLEALTGAFHRASAAAGVCAAAAGHHAGEFETSIVLALRPDLVRRELLGEGLTDAGSDPQAVFYPNLRQHAASGVVGDPRAASATRGAAYLDAWVEHLVGCFRRTDDQSD